MVQDIFEYYDYNYKKIMGKLYLNMNRHIQGEKLKKAEYCVEKNTYNRKITKDVSKKIFIRTLFDIFHTIAMIY